MFFTYRCRWDESPGGEHMKKPSRLLVVPALAVVTLAAFAAGPDGPQQPQPVPPIVQPYPGPIGPDSGPVDPTPVEPPPS